MRSRCSGVRSAGNFRLLCAIHSPPEYLSLKESSSPFGKSSSHSEAIASDSFSRPQTEQLTSRGFSSAGSTISRAERWNASSSAPASSSGDFTQPIPMLDPVLTGFTITGYWNFSSIRACTLFTSV